MRMNALLTLGFVAGIGAALVGCGEEPIPANVSYLHDIKPLVEARCIRCHGAGGGDNDDPAINHPTPGTLRTPTSDFTRLDAHLAADGKTTINGLMAFTGPNGGSFPIFLASPMPPRPAPPLTTREHDMLIQWASNPLP
jgi:hypothetical protein